MVAVENTISGPIPFHLAAERSLLGAVLLRPAVIDSVAYLLPRDFLEFAHQHIWEAILALHAEEVPFDAITIADQLGTRLPSVGGPSYLVELAREVPTADNVEHYARMIAAESLTRRTRMALEQLSRDRRLEAGDLLEAVRRMLGRLDVPAALRPKQDQPAFAENLKTLVGMEEPTEEDVPSPEDWVVPGMVPREGVTFIAGPPKVSKTFLVLDLSLAVALEQLFCGRWPVFKGRVLAILEEDPRRRIRTRMWWLARGRGVDPRMIGDDLRLAVMTRFRLDSPESLAKLEAEIVHYKPAIVLIDALARVHGAEENDRTGMRAVTVPLQDLCSRYHIAIVVVHHFRGLREGDEDKRAGELLRGTTDLHALARSVIGLRKRKGVLALDAGGNDGEIPFQHLELFIGKDDQGKNIARYSSRGSADEAETSTDAEKVFALISASAEGLTTEAIKAIVKERELRIGKDRLSAALDQLEGAGSIWRFTSRAPWRVRGAA